MLGGRASEAELNGFSFDKINVQLAFNAVSKGPAADAKHFGTLYAAFINHGNIGSTSDHTYITAMGLLRVGMDTLTSGVAEGDNNLRNKLNRVLRV